MKRKKRKKRKKESRKKYEKKLKKDERLKKRREKEPDSLDLVSHLNVSQLLVHLQLELFAIATGTSAVDAGHCDVVPAGHMQQPVLGVASPVHSLRNLLCAWTCVAGVGGWLGWWMGWRVGW